MRPPQSEPPTFHTTTATVPLPAHLSLPATGDHQSSPHHLFVRRGGAAALQGSMQPPTPPSRAAARAESSVRSCAP